jgi:AcrR family transcriptional regulator
MANYRNGIETREALYASAQRTFSAKGYSGASIKDIVTGVNSKLGLFTYYFESKEALALQILFQLKAATYAEMERAEAVSEERSDLLLMDMARTRVWLDLLASCPHVARFSGEVSLTAAHSARAAQERLDFCRMLGEQCPALASASDGTDPDGVRLHATLMAGMLTQFCRDLPQLSLASPLEDVVDRFLTICYGLCVADKPQLAAYVRRSRTLTQDVCLTADETFSVSYR